MFLIKTNKNIINNNNTIIKLFILLLEFALSITKNYASLNNSNQFLQFKYIKI